MLKHLQYHMLFPTGVGRAFWYTFDQDMVGWRHKDMRGMWNLKMCGVGTSHQLPKIWLVICKSANFIIHFQTDFVIEMK